MATLPPGFRFHPTDVELVKYYLRKKVQGKPLKLEVISEIELYKFSPWDLPEKSCLRSRDLEWYFFCPRDRKYTSGPRANRSTEIGYWKTTGKDRAVSHNSQTVGMKKTLIFHLGRAPRGERTNWVMHEYRLEDKDLVNKGSLQDAYVLCKIFEKSGPGPRNGEQHGAPFKEEEWENDDNDDVINGSLITYNNNIPPTLADHQNLAMVESSVDFNNEFNSRGGSFAEPSEARVDDEDPSSHELFNIDELLELLSDNEDGAVVSNGNDVQNADTFVPHTCDNVDVQDAFLLNGDHEIYSGLGDIATQEQLHNLYSYDNLEYDLHEMLSDVKDGNIIKLDDLLDPLGSEYGISDNLRPPYETLGVPFEVDNNGCNLDHPTATVWNAEEIGNKCVQQSSSGGEIYTGAPTLEHMSGGEGSYSKLQYYLLDSIPASPASAAEYSPPKGENSESNVLSSRSSIHFKAEVITVKCMCNGSVLSDPLRAHPGICCDSGKPSKKLVRDPSPRGGGFTLVFLLGVVSALVWVFLLAMGAKFGRYAWKNFMQPS